MGWTTPTTWTTGSVPTAANFNAHIRDNLNAVGSHEWSTYAPVLTGSGGNPNPSAKSGQYVRAGNLVVYQYLITQGTTIGSGDYTVALPVNGNFDNDLRCGSGFIEDENGGGYVTCHYSSSTNASGVKVMWNAKTADGVLTHASPYTQETGDILSGFLTYRAAG